jgi:hypothetical protein
MYLPSHPGIGSGSATLHIAIPAGCLGTDPLRLLLRDRDAAGNRQHVGQQASRAIAPNVEVQPQSVRIGPEN